jgi:GNAT superfamily N-acetyltransferase
MSEGKKVYETEIHPAGPDDASAISALLLQSFAEYRGLYTDEGFTATTPASEEVLNRLKEGPIWVAVRNDAIVGTASAVHKGERLYVRGMAVLPSERGQRIGELLLECIERYAAQHNCNRLFLSTTPFLTGAIRLYERFGFRRTPEGPHDLFGTPLFTMERITL